MAITGAPADVTSSTVTFLFADMEGSTRLLQRLGDDYDAALERVIATVRAAVEEVGGHEQLVEGDGYFATFDTAIAAVAAAAAVQRRLATQDWPHGETVRMRVGLHTGHAHLGADGYVGLDVHRAARIADAAHGGQVVVSQAVLVLAERELPAGVGTRDLGVLRLRDLAEPERLFQLVIDGLDNDFPPLRSLDRTPNNLPTQLTSFIGRDREVARLLEMLHSARLVTVTGPGGTGKTRTVLQAGACLAGEYRHGVWFVPLAEVRDPAFVTSAIVSALRLRESANAEPTAQLLEHLQDRNLLLILDNFEQLLESAPLVSDLLAAAPGVQVVVTSRAPLHVYGEQELALPPLPVPAEPARATIDSLTQYEAVRLFIDRARAVKPDFEVNNANAPAIAEICSRLDGLPLAIELAAARIKLLPPEAMLARLRSGLIDVGTGPRDRPDRQQTLRGAIAWSYELLEPDAQRALRALSVFDGGWGLEDAEAVCGVDIIEQMSALVDHSLVRQADAGGAARFDMLQTIRDFALDMLERAGEAAAIRSAHAERYLALAEDCGPHLLGADQARHTEALIRERANCRAAIDTFVVTGRTDAALRMCAALWRFWQKVALHEGTMQIERVLALPDVESYPEALSGTLEAAGGLAYWRGQLEGSKEPYERALAIEQRLGRVDGIANALYNLSFADGLTGSWQQAVARQQQALELYASVGDQAGVAKAHWGLGVSATFAKRYAEARTHLEEALSLARAQGDFFHTGWALHMLADVDLAEGRLAEALEAATTALRMFADAGDVAAVTLLLGDFAELERALGHPERQATLLGASSALQQLTGSELARVSAELMGHAALDAERFSGAWEAGLAMSLPEAVAYALSRPADAGAEGRAPVTAERS